MFSFTRSRSRPKIKKFQTFRSRPKQAGSETLLSAFRVIFADNFGILRTLQALNADNIGIFHWIKKINLTRILNLVSPTQNSTTQPTSPPKI